MQFFRLSSASKIQRCLLLLPVILLTSCGGGGTGKPIVTDITAQGLAFGGKPTFIVTGFFAAGQALTLDVPNCTGQAITSSSSTEAGITCELKTAGNLPVQLRNQAGEVVFAKTFTVPQPTVMLLTSKGNMVAELNPQAAPNTVLNFLNYVKAGFYTNTIFHRVIPNFVIQGGGFKPGLVPQSNEQDPIALESNNGLHNTRGTLAMARTPEPDSATSQFYFNLVDNASLDYQNAANPGYAVFGKIVQGLDVMDAIGAVPTATRDGHANVPVTDVVVTRVLQLQ